MTKFNEEEFVALAKSNVEQALKVWASKIIADNDDEDINEEDYDPTNASEIEDEFCRTIGSISLELVDDEGGHEGGGEYVQRTFAFKQIGKAVAHFQITGSYYSNYGTEWDEEIKQVYPHRVLTTVWKDSPQENPPKE